MPGYSFEGSRPSVADDAFIAPTATLIGDVTVESGASIWFGAVLRGDYGPIVVRERANVQDGALVHVPPGVTADIGPGVTVAHHCVIHGAVLEEECLVGNGSTVLDGARVGARSMIGAHSLVAAGFVVPAGVLAVGAPAAVKGPLRDAAAAWVRSNPAEYADLAQRYRRGLTPIEL
jgi:carbonic anhydrase/acetyltransferase-like protein (isoleucine patch superfamily)